MYRWTSRRRWPCSTRSSGTNKKTLYILQRALPIPKRVLYILERALPILKRSVSFEYADEPADAAGHEARGWAQQTPSHHRDGQGRGQKNGAGCPRYDRKASLWRGRQKGVYIRTYAHFTYICIYICVCVCMYVYMNKRMYVYIYVCACIYIYLYICIYMYIYMCRRKQCTHVRVYTCIYISFSPRIFSRRFRCDVCMCVCVWTCIRGRVCVRSEKECNWGYICTYMHICVYMYIYTYICKYTMLSQSFSWSFHCIMWLCGCVGVSMQICWLSHVMYVCTHTHLKWLWILRPKRRCSRLLRRYIHKNC